MNNINPDLLRTQLPSTSGGTAPFIPVTEEQTRYFDDTTTLIIAHQVSQQPIQVHVPVGKEVLVGRAANSVMIPDVDLSFAIKLGVSRIHAIFTQQNNNLYICDMGSANFTLLNGSRVHPGEIRLVCDGDQLAFGRLLCRVKFHQDFDF